MDLIVVSVDMVGLDRRPTMLLCAFDCCVC